jgi:hypothetical protein
MSNELLCKDVLSELALPEDTVQYIAEIVSTIEEKAKSWQELASIPVESHKDLEGIKLAKRNRLQVKNERLEAEKFLKAKREEVQEKMRVFTNEDKAYLKLIQFYEKVAKGFEEQLNEKETILEKYEAQQKAILREKRLAALSEVTEDAHMYPVETMSEESFNNMFQGFKLAKEKAEEVERLRLEEEERILLKQKEERELAQQKQEIFNQRRLALAPYTSVEYNGKGTLSLETTEEEFEAMKKAANIAVTEKEKELEALRLRQQKEEKRQAEERARQEAIKARHSAFFTLGMRSDGDNFSFNGDVDLISIEFLASCSQEEFVSLLSKTAEQVDAAKAKQEEERLAAAKAQKEAEEAAAKQKAEQEKAAQALKSGDKEALWFWISTFSLPEVPQGLNNEALKLKSVEIIAKFEGFTKWAKKEINAL